MSITPKEGRPIGDTSQTPVYQVALGMCTMFSESATFDRGFYIPGPLTEAGTGDCLPCIMKPRADLVLQVRITSEVAKTEATTFLGVLVEVSQLSASTMCIGSRLPTARS